MREKRLKTPFTGGCDQSFDETVPALWSFKREALEHFFRVVGGVWVLEELVGKTVGGEEALLGWIIDVMG